MKNKIIAISLSLILSLSSTTAFAAENMNTYFLNLCSNNQAIKWTVLDELKAPDLTAQNTTKAVENTQTSKPAEKTETTNSVLKDTTSTTTASSNLNYEQKVVELVNIERQKNGLSALALDSSVSNVARTKSKDMAANNYFAHQSPTYGSAGDMLKQSGINWSAWGENIASGQRTPEAVVTAWMNSEGHRANILSSNFSKIGVGYATNSNGTPYWTQMFIK
jgi:uncharacterized YkwD family protein